MSGPAQSYVLNTGLFALSGGITNWLAIHMLFEKVPGFYGSGVIPLRFEEFKLGIRSLIMEQFFGKAELSSFISETAEAAKEIEDKIKQSINELDLDEAFESLIEVIMASSFGGMLGMVGGRDALDPLKSPFVDKMREFFQKQFSGSSFQEHIQEALNSALDDESIRAKLDKMIDQRLDQMTPEMVKDIIQDMIRQHLGWLVVWGCFFGGSIGLIVSLLNSL